MGKWGNCCFDYANPVVQFSWSHRDEFEAEAPICLFMDPFKTQGVLEPNPPRFSWSDKAEITYKKDTLLIDGFSFGALQLARKGG